MPGRPDKTIQVEYTPEFKRNLRGLVKKYRLIYHLRTATNIVFITIYSKLEQGDISADRIRYIIKEFELGRLG